MKNDTIVITQERMAGWLMFNRFHKVDEKPDLKDPNRKIFIFKNSTELHDIMEKYNQFKEIVRRNQNNNEVRKDEEAKTTVDIRDNWQ